jgi:AraC family transcriptional activator of pobA
MPAMTRSPAPTVAFREVRHHGPDDWLHCESLAVRGELHAWTIPAHRHEDVHQFELLEAGEGVATVDGVRVALVAPCALMLPPGAVHGFTFEPGCRGRQVTLPSRHLRAALAGALPLAAQLEAALVLDRSRVEPVLAQVQALFDALAAEFERRRPGRTEVLQALSLPLVVWFLRQGGGDGEQVRRDVARDTLVRRYVALLEEHFRVRQSLAFYADQLGVTRDHLSRTCRQVRGLGALDLLQERRLHEARRLLAHTPLKVAEIAQALGFEDAAYFSRFFARRTGASPAGYRQAITQGGFAVPD